MFRTLFHPCVNCRRPVQTGGACQPCADREREEELADRLRNEHEADLRRDAHDQQEQIIQDLLEG